jgi:DNA-binding HxlR family transcriptional regulator
VRDMRGYGQYCPIALAAEVFAERWTPIIVRNLHLGCHHFGEILDGAPGLPRSLLSQRLQSLQRAGVVTCTRTGRATSYELTPMGKELSELCLALGVWGARWCDAQPADQDPYLALWTMVRLIEPASLPRHRIVVRFDVTRDTPPDRFWLVLTRAGNEVCVQDPGYPEDGIVVTDTSSLVRWYAGETTLAAASLEGSVTVSAPPWLEREMVRWGRLSPFAGIELVSAAH